jgi:hypothetical protein
MSLNDSTDDHHHLHRYNPRRNHDLEEQQQHLPVTTTVTNDINHTDNNEFVYSYVPKDLVASYERLKQDGWNTTTTTLPAVPSSDVNNRNNSINNKNKSTIIVAAVQMTGSQLPCSDIMGYLSACRTCHCYGGHDVWGTMNCVTRIVVGTLFLSNHTE